MRGSRETVVCASVIAAQKMPVLCNTAPDSFDRVAELMDRTIHVRLLGGLEIDDKEGHRLTLTRKDRALLAYLAIRGTTGQTRDFLAALLWRDSPEKQARANLRQALSSIRKALGSEHSGALQADNDRISLDTSITYLDVVEFESLSNEDDTQNLQAAVDLYRGDFLAGFAVKEDNFESWTQVERERLRRLAAQSLLRLLSMYEDQRNMERSILAATKLLYMDPTEETAHRALMRAYSVQNRQAAALKQYETCRIALQKDLGVEPQPETTELFREIRRKQRHPSDHAATGAQPSSSAYQSPSAAPLLPTRP